MRLMRANLSDAKDGDDVAGLLGLSLFCCFEGGVEFHWGLVCDDSTRGDYVSECDDDDGIPSVTFYGTDDGLDSLVCVPFDNNFPPQNTDS